MIKQIRLGVFETNSSNTHAMTVVNGDDYDAWQRGELMFHSYSSEFLTLEEARKENAKSLRENFMHDPTCPWKTIDRFKKEDIDAYERGELSLSEILDRCQDENGKKDEISGYDAMESLYLPADLYNEFAKKRYDYLDDFGETFTTKGGERVVIWGYYGHD